MKILITGGNGFLGSSLAEKFYNEGFEVSVLVRNRSNLQRLNHNKFNYKIYKINEPEEAEAILTIVKPDILIHTICNYGRSKEPVLKIFDSNYRIGIILINKLIEIRKPILFINIGTTLAESTNFYAFSKHQFSNFGKFVYKYYSFINFKNIILQHIYGPGDDETKFVTFLINSCIRNTPIIELTKGIQKRDFIYIKDATNAIFLICKKIEKINQIDIELGSGQLISIKDLALSIHKITNSNSILNFGAIKERGDENNIPAANLELMSQLNWFPLYNLEKGLNEILNIELK